MSKLEVNTLAPQTGTTITIGESGDTVALGSGASQTLASNVPAFEAYRSGSGQSITNNTFTKIQFNSEVFDTDSAYDNATNYRFTVPSGQAGKYYVYSQVWMQAATSTTFRDCQLIIRKNGSDYKNIYWYFNNNPIRWIIPSIFATMDLSVADYIEIFILTATTDNAATTVTQDKYSNFGAYKLIGV